MTRKVQAQFVEVVIAPHTPRDLEKIKTGYSRIPCFTNIFIKKRRSVCLTFAKFEMILMSDLPGGKYFPHEKPRDGSEADGETDNTMHSYSM